MQPSMAVKVWVGQERMEGRMEKSGEPMKPQREPDHELRRSTIVVFRLHVLGEICDKLLDRGVDGILPQRKILRPLAHCVHKHDALKS